MMRASVRCSLLRVRSRHQLCHQLSLVLGTGSASTSCESRRALSAGVTYGAVLFLGPQCVPSANTPRMAGTASGMGGGTLLTYPAGLTSRGWASTDRKSVAYGKSADLA